MFSLDFLIGLSNNAMELLSNIQEPPRPRIIAYSLYPRYYLRQSALVYKSDSHTVNLILKID